MEKNDLRIVKTKDNIDNSLITNLSKYPFRKITVETICKEARINRSTFYKYYLDKYDLLEQYLHKTLDEFKQNMNAEFIQASPSELTKIVYSQNFRNILIFFRERSYVYQILWHAAIDQQIFNEMVNIIQQNMLDLMKEEMDNNPDKLTYSTLYSYLFASNLMTVVHWWFEYNSQMSVDDVSKLMDDNMQKGLFKTYKKLVE